MISFFSFSYLSCDLKTPSSLTRVYVNWREGQDFPNHFFRFIWPFHWFLCWADLGRGPADCRCISAAEVVQVCNCSCGLSCSSHFLLLLPSHLPLPLSCENPVFGISYRSSSTSYSFRVTLNAGFKNQKAPKQRVCLDQERRVHFPDNTVSQQNINVNKWIIESLVLGAFFFLAPGRVIVSYFQSRRPNELQGDRSLSITGYFSSIVISAASENHKALNN